MEAAKQEQVFAFTWLDGCIKDSSMELGNMEPVRLERIKPGFGFRSVHPLHGEIDSQEQALLAQLCDGGHVVLPRTATLELTHHIWFRVWIRIGINKESAEMVSTRLFHEADMKLFWTIRPGLDNNELALFDHAAAEWKKKNKPAIFPTVEQPFPDVIKDVDKVRLHQKKALSWMLFRENLPHHQLPPFWEDQKDGNGMYRGWLTCFITSKRPQMLRGGILADESGMGKTLSLLCLIASTRKDISSCSSSTSVHASKKIKLELDLDLDLDVALQWRPTLVVCPPLVLSTWEAQIQQFTHPGSLRVCVYSGRKSNKIIRDPSFLSRHDLVLTTYDTVVADYQSSSPILYQIDWWRVILDDAHVLKGSTSRATTPCANLKATRRWAVTGKPVHIDIENYDLYPIFAFLQVQQFCDKRDWEKVVSSGIFPHVMSRLELLMEFFSLRRTMPVRFVQNHLVALSEDEQDLYMSVRLEARRKDCSRRDAQATVLRLWRSCNSVSLLRLSCTEILSSVNFQDLEREPDLHNKWVTVMLQEHKDCACPICWDQPEPDDVVITRCGHLFCTSCITRLFEEHKKMNMNFSCCPMCCCLLNKHDVFYPQKGTSLLEKIKHLVSKESSSASMSSKVSALLNLLLKSRMEDPNRKSVVLSQFQRMLMLVGGVLSEAGFDVRFMVVSKTKDKTVKEFSKAEHPVILLSTFNTLSNIPGLDLSAASNVYMMEPCWNPHTEETALARIRRLGNEDDLKVIRLVCRSTIEERLLEVRKREQIYCSRNSKREVNFDGFSFSDLLVLLHS